MKDSIFNKYAYNREEKPEYSDTFFFIKGFATALNWEQTLIALNVARHFHDGQYRKSGEPYLCHPLKVANTLIEAGIRDDATVAAAILHDVVEDCADKMPTGGDWLVAEYGVSEEVLHLITLLSKPHGASPSELEQYFEAIAQDPRAMLVKLSDRLHNMNTLHSFSCEKRREYIHETMTYILPMASFGKANYPRREYNNAMRQMKTAISNATDNHRRWLDELDRSNKSGVEVCD